MGKKLFDESHYQFEMPVIVPFNTMKEWITKIFVALGMEEINAEIVADTLVVADCRGVYSHGIMRTPIYGNRILMGGTNPKTKIDIVRDKGAFSIIDGNNSMGQPVSHFAMKHAIENAKVHGVSSVSVIRSNHNGAIAYWPMMSLPENMIAFSISASAGNVFAPWGGTDARLGHSPFAYVIPAGKHDPIVCDMALSTVARGKIILARRHGKKIPITWGINNKGEPTTDPNEVYWGSLLPIGGYKGYAIAYGLELFSSALLGTDFGKTQGDFYEKPEIPQNIGQFFYVLNISALTDLMAFKNRIDDSIEYLKASPLAEGTSEILVPGEPEWRTYKRQIVEGIHYSSVTLEDVRDFSKKMGVEPMV